MKSFNATRPAIAVMAIGIARAAYDAAREFAAAHYQLDRPLPRYHRFKEKLARMARKIEIGRLLTMRAAWKLEQGEKGQAEVSMAKIQVADALHRAVDTAIQLLGAKGYSKDTPLEWMYRYARQARLVDGASEVHRMIVARALLKEGRDFFAWR